ncbi:ATP-binding protein [Pseudomonas sp. S1(2024)]|uniref:ATP-binding protein n=1 Tax=Pseudomonas sp. S1(2024) TaxID=3390191 RepID=UPI00397D5BF5
MLVLDDKSRAELFRTHPVKRDKYTILTPMIKASYAMFREKVFFRHSGAFMFASPRMGKTRCALAIKDLLSSEFPDSYVLYHTMDSERATYLVRDLLSSANLAVANRESRAIQLERYIEHIAAECEVRGGDQFVLIVDEMQLMLLQAFNDLLVVHNRLDAKGISMTTLGFGQPQILEARNLLISLEAFNLVARFLSEPVRFEGCLSANVFQSILYNFDEVTEFPPNSGCSYTDFFLPIAFSNKYRLAAQHGDIWDALVQLVGEGVLPRIPFSYIIRLLNHLLIVNRAKDSLDFRLSSKMIDVSLKATFLTDFFESMRIK